MTTNKAQKRAVRARMDKTGEAYTTARHYLLDRHHVESEASVEAAPDGGQPAAASGLDEPAQVQEPAAAADAPSALPPRVTGPGMSDAAIQKVTGRTWDEWFALLDAWGGTAHNHTKIARHVHEAYGIDGWWAQNVTVGYERARGMRAVNERPDGFSVNASKTFPVPVARLFAAFMDEEEREHWLDGIDLRPRTSQPFKSARFDVLPGEGRLAVTFIARGDAKSSVQLEQARLADAEAIARQRTLWKAQLDRLADYLTGEG